MAVQSGEILWSVEYIANSGVWRLSWWRKSGDHTDRFCQSPKETMGF